MKDISQSGMDLVFFSQKKLWNFVHLNMFSVFKIQVIHILTHIQYKTALQNMNSGNHLKQ